MSRHQRKRLYLIGGHSDAYVLLCQLRPSRGLLMSWYPPRLRPPVPPSGDCVRGDDREDGHWLADQRFVKVLACRPGHRLPRTVAHGTGKSD